MQTWILWQRLEGALVFGAGVALYLMLGAGMAWWWAVLWFFLPDLSFAAYGAGRRVGAWVYNLWHLYGLGALIMALGIGLADTIVFSVGALWLAHAGFDRMLGYGLKSTVSFQDTHLGPIGHQRER